ncbi:MAG: hypothetical protein RIS48_833 [Pseudomonadota bacterium]
MNVLQIETAILLTEWTGRSSASSTGQLCNPLMPLLGKPLLQRSVENLVQLGCKQVHVFLGDNPAPVRELLGNGERWGMQLHYHYLQVEEDLPDNLRRLQLDPASQYWLACDDRLPWRPEQADDNLAWYWTDASERRHWAGLGRFSGQWLAALPGCRDRQDFEARLMAAPTVQSTPALRPLSCESDADFLRSAGMLLDSEPGSSPDSIHVGRGVVVHPSAVLKGPVWLGHLVHVDAGVELGPYAVLEDGVVVDQGAAIQHSVVVSDTYVGKELNLHQCVAAPGRLASVNQDVVLDELCPTLLTSVRAPGGATRPALLQRLALWLLQASLLPLWWWARLALRWTQQQAPVARMRLLRPGDGHGQVQTLHLADTLAALQAAEPGALTRHFVHTFYPGLSAVLRGQLVLCGPKLRDVDHVARLPAHWRNLYQQHPCGLLNPSMAGVSGHATQDPYLQDVLTVADRSLRLRLVLLGRYLAQLVQELLAPDPSPRFNLNSRK